MRCSAICCQCYLNDAILFANSRISRYTWLGEIRTARRIFDELPHKSIVSWNSIISGYFQNGHPDEARRLFDKMPERNLASWNGMVSGYVKNGMLKDAIRIFDMMPQRNIVSWTAMIRGYVQQGITSEAESLFRQMPQKNVVSWTVMLGGLIQDGRIDDARLLFDQMPEKDVVARTNMISGYCQEGRVADARKIFDEMPRRNIITWTTMISGYAHNSRVEIAHKLFEVMPEKNEVSWTAMLTGYVNCMRVEEAMKLFEMMPNKSLTPCNVMLRGLGENGKVSEARRIFDLMEEKDDGTWSAMIKGYERSGRELEALDTFRCMQRVGVKANYPALISILSVSSTLACLDHGKEIHAEVVKLGFNTDVFVASALITMYIKCGNLVRAETIFRFFASKDVVMWNSMVTGYAQHGLGNDALRVFSEMCALGLLPDDITFVGVLSACSYTGKVKEGKKFFNLMVSDYKLEPKAQHYACMVDLLGRAGHISEAMNLINNMPIEADAVVWGSFLGACRTHMNMEFAEIAAKKLMGLEPKNSGPYVLLSHIYASKGRWKDVEDLRHVMKLRKVRKSPGCSWIDVEKKVHMFTGGDAVDHPEHKAIIGMLEKLSGMLRDWGYCPESRFVLHDVDEEQKEHNLSYHSEKLALAYGLLKVPKGLSIRIMKNLRVCGDCHLVFKLISKITGRQIILRDANRFHHFEDGSCSCGDYW
ncbi:pentatricopeptide repeat-containing protein At1g56690, mitochondrial-like [Aristolochia californica]|uniref:pentatricopeptide repeat-containing protein At1g56690, mitochondrial-like n=1 Tax=Aristolochia californica TaxID=171875 RepID=UPI0035D73589